MIQNCNDVSVLHTIEELKQIIIDQPELKYIIKKTIEDSLQEINDKIEIIAKDVNSKAESEKERISKERHEFFVKSRVLVKIKEGLPELFS